MSDLITFLSSGDPAFEQEARRLDTHDAWLRYWATVPSPTPHPALNFRGHERNEFGKWVSRFLCGTCGVEYTICPALLPDETADADCFAPECASYSIDRDPIALLGIGEASLIRKANDD